MKVRFMCRQYPVGEGKPYKVGYAYKIKDEYYIYWGEQSEVTWPGIYLKNGKMTIRRYHGENERPTIVAPAKKPKKDEDIFKSILATKDKVLEDVPVNTLSPEERGDVFAPPIDEGDNILSKIVKEILAKKQINLKELLPRFKDTMEMNNFKRSLIINKMSVEKFERWMEILGYEWSVRYDEKE